MNPQEMYDAWRKHRERIEVGADFSDKVMARVRGQATGTQPRAESLPPWWRLVVARPFARAALIAAGVTLGLIRIVMTLHLIMFA